MRRFEIFMRRFPLRHGAFAAVPGERASSLPDSPLRGQRGRCPSHLYLLLPSHADGVRLEFRGDPAKFKKRLLCASYASHAACPNHSSRKAHNRKGWIIDVSMVVYGTQNLFVDDFCCNRF
jgi:hypothetical protein